MKLYKGDTVQVMIGKDAGKTAAIERVFDKEQKVLLPNINQFKRHLKARMQGEESQILTITKPLPISNVQLICPQCKKLTRVGYSIDRQTKVRVCRKCKKAI